MIKLNLKIFKKLKNIDDILEYILIIKIIFL